MTADALIQVENLKKSFGQQCALDGLSLCFNAGTIHALIGQNGCGKSTLVKCLTGVHEPDSGTVWLRGQPVEFPLRDSAGLGVAVIHQDLGFVDSLTVLENLGAVSRYGTRVLFPVSVRAERRVAQRLMNDLGIDIPLDMPMSKVSPGDRAMLGIVRAMRVLDQYQGRKMFILDEPTAALSREESEQVIRLMRSVADRGSAVVFISHRLGEVLSGADQVTVMRSGAVVFEAGTKETSREELVQHMLGRAMSEFFPSPPKLSTDIEGYFEARNLSGATVRDCGFSVKPGEILGITGLAGMGQEEVAGLLSGAVEPISGEIVLEGEVLTGGNSARMIANGVCLVPANRLRDGCWAMASATENLTLPILHRFRIGMFIRPTRERKYSIEVLENVKLHPLAPERPMITFSGGNQQKVVFAKWLQMNPKVLILDEPTQGVDPGAAHGLLDEVAKLAEGKAAIVVTSGDHEQLVKTCHRVLVLSHGRITAELEGTDLTEEKLLAACSSA